MPSSLGHLHNFNFVEAVRFTTNGHILSLLQFANYKRTNNILFVYMLLDAPTHPECIGKVLLHFKPGLDGLAPRR